MDLLFSVVCFCLGRMVGVSRFRVWGSGFRVKAGFGILGAEGVRDAGVLLIALHMYCGMRYVVCGRTLCHKWCALA